MPRWLQWMLSLLEVARFPIVAGIIANVWVMTIIALRLEPAQAVNPALLSLGLPLSLLLGGMLAGGLAGCALALNDVLDLRHDRAFAPWRPLPEGRIAQNTTTVAAMMGLLLAIGASVAFGGMSVLLTVAAAMGVIFYNLTGRFIPSIGIVTLGVLYALTMLIPNPSLQTVWPVVLVVTHLMAVSALQHGLSDRRPRLRPVDGWVICGGWVFLMLLLLVIQQVSSPSVVDLVVWERWHDRLRWSWIGPLVVLLLLIFWLLRSWQHGAGPRKMAQLLRVSSGYAMVLYAVAWCLSLQLWWEWLLPAGLGVLAAITTAALALTRQSALTYRLPDPRDHGLH